MRPRSVLALIGLIAAPAFGQSDGPMTIADLPAYRAALSEDKVAAVPVTFRDLWDRPDEFKGRRVAVSGRVVAVFHQGGVGQFPALAEVWAFTPESDPFCLVCPETKDHPAPVRGSLVGFEGTFLRKIRYRGGDVDRLAPLVVGPGPIRVDQAAPVAADAPRSSSDAIWVLVVGGLIVLALVRVALRRPRPGGIVEGPPPVFDDGEASDDGL
jgi:hypothetical protein